MHRTQAEEEKPSRMRVVTKEQPLTERWRGAAEENKASKQTDIAERIKKKSKSRCPGTHPGTPES